MDLQENLFCVQIFAHAYLLTYLITYLRTHLLTYLLKYLRNYLINYLPTYLPTDLLLANLIYYLLTYLLSPCSTVLLEKLPGSQPVKKFPKFYGTRKFITAFTNARHLSLSSASSIQSIHPHPTSIRSILICSSHLLLGLPSDLFPSVFRSKTLYTPLLSPTGATCLAHIILLEIVNQTILGEG